MEKNGVSQRDVCRALDLKPSAMSLWSSGKRKPREDMARKIANYFNVSYSYLIDDETKYTVKIPVLGDVAGGVPIDAIQTKKGEQ